jgi:hypothetical protein
MLLVGNNIANGRNLAGYFNTCSYGQVTLPTANVKVLGPVEIPCSGTLNDTETFSTGPYFTSTSCDEIDNMPKWHYWLGAWAKAKHNVNVDDYHHSVILLPRQFSRTVKGELLTGSLSPAQSSPEESRMSHPAGFV